MCCEDQHEALQTSRKNFSSQGGLDKRRKMSVKTRKVKKTPVCKKYLLKIVALAVDEKAKAIKSSYVRVQSWWRT